jgi:hypothetical protein
VIEWGPTAKLEVMQLAVYADPTSETFALSHPGIAVVEPSAKNPTVPLGALPFPIVAVKVTDCPTVDGLPDVASVVVVVALVQLMVMEPSPPLVPIGPPFDAVAYVALGPTLPPAPPPAPDPPPPPPPYPPPPPPP